MLFSSASFLFCFLPITLLFYYLSPKKLKNPVLLIASLVFYCLGSLRHLPLLLFSALFNWGAGLSIGAVRGQKGKKAILALAVFGNLSLLFYYKYSGFFFSLLGVDFQAPALPVGISFYTFQAMSYTIDVYRGDAAIEKSPFSFATYLCLFPQLIAGPIVRYTDVAYELEERRHTLSDFAEGCFLFAVGLAKKVVIADTLAKLVALYREGTPTVLFAWLYAIAFTLEIYFDFSGYSDMALGLGRLFGFHFPHNFHYPYIAASVTEFWHRWHITLSSWFKSYVYIPLGGNRRGKARLAFNLIAVWLLTGLWHGSAFTFILWGALYALLLVFEKFGGLRLLKKLPVPLTHIYTLFFVIIGFVIFNAATVTEAFRDIGALFGGAPLADERSLYYLKSYLPLLLLSAVAATPLPTYLLSGKFLKKQASHIPSPTLLWGKALAMSLLLMISCSYVVGESFRPFLYFRF